MAQQDSAKTITQTRRKAGTHPLYRVLLLNDDYTPMFFVTHILETVFHKSPSVAEAIMLEVHFKGAGVCGTYPYEIAETKVHQVHGMAKADGHPLKAAIEPCQ